MQSNNVLVTGADGFIGSHLVEQLLRAGKNVRAFCLYNSFGRLGWIDSLSESVKSELNIVLGDIRDPVCVREATVGATKCFIWRP